MTLARQTLLDRTLRLFSDVRPGEGRGALSMLVSAFLLLTAYYVIKTVREPMILADGSAELKSWASAGQAVALLVFVPLYGWLASRLQRRALLAWVSAFFIVCLQLFYPVAVDAVRVTDAMDSASVAAEHVEESAFESATGMATSAHVDGSTTAAASDDDVSPGALPGETNDEEEPAKPPAPELADFFRLGFIFYIWTGIFSLAMIAHFWSFANDLYKREEGERLFPIIALGATVGAAAGSKITSLLFEAGVGIPAMLQIATAILVLYAALMWWTSRDVEIAHWSDPRESTDELALDGQGAFSIILRSPYLRTIAAVIFLLNLVNTNGEYILSRFVLETALALESAGEIASVGAYIGQFYGDFFSVVNIATMLVQGLLVSRLLKYGGLAAVLAVLPIVALGAYGLVVLGGGLALFRWAKTAENTSDYSIMNTAKAIVWLPTSRAEKYKAKQAVDTLVVRAGDLAATGLMVVGTQVWTWSVRGFAAVNVALIALWLVASVALWRRNRALT